MPVSGRRRFVRAAPWVFVIAVCLSWNAVMLFQQQTVPRTPWLVGWDDNFYFAWGRSLAVDVDWDFENDVAVAASRAPLGQGAAREFRSHLEPSERTKTGRVRNKYAAGRS